MSNGVSGQAAVRLDRDSADRVVGDLFSSAAQVAQIAGTLERIGFRDFAPLFLRWSDGTGDCAAAVAAAIDGTDAADRASAAAMSRDMP